MSAGPVTDWPLGISLHNPSYNLIQQMQNKDTLAQALCTVAGIEMSCFLNFSQVYLCWPEVGVLHNVIRSLADVWKIT